MKRIHSIIALTLLAVMAVGVTCFAAVGVKIDGVDSGAATTLDFHNATIVNDGATYVIPLSGVNVGVGTTGYIPIYTSPTTISTSGISNIGNNVGIGTPLPFHALDVYGEAVIHGPNERVGGSRNDNYIDFNDVGIGTTGLNAYTSVSGGLVLTNNHIWYLKQNEDIDAFITSNEVVNGDVLILAAGTYTITADIDITKKIKIWGQGTNKTTITTSTALVNMLDISTDNIEIADLTLSSTGAGTGGSQRAINLSATGTNIFSDIVFRNVNITMSGAGVQRGAQISDSGITFINGVISITSSNDEASGFRAGPASTAEAPMALNFTNVKVNTSGAGSATSRAWYMSESTATQVSTINLYNCFGVSVESGTSTTNAVFSNAVSTADMVVNLYGGSYSGADNDLLQSGTGVINIYNTHLVNNTTSGTISYVGGNWSTRLLVGGNVGIGTVNPNGSLHIDGATGFGTVKADGDTGGCIMLKYRDNSTWLECGGAAGALVCTADADGVCDGT